LSSTPGYKKRRAIRFVASLPRSHYGKVLRAQLIAQAERDGADSGAANSVRSLSPRLRGEGRGEGPL